MRASDVLAHRSPEALAPCLHVVPGADSTDASHRERHLVREGIPALALACALAPLFTQMSVIWGPTGSVGFELASGVATAHAHSDLDLLIRCDERLPIARAQDIARQLDGRRQAQGGCRIDVILETPHGAVSLLEYASARDGAQVLIRGDRAARLVSDPWGVDDGDAVQKG
jgi:phosphoribosyl-dephospho-CoA transferase